MRHRARRVAWGVACAAALAIAPSTAQAAAFDLAGTDWEGCAELARLARADLGDSHVVLGSKIDLTTLGPRDAIVMLHPVSRVDAAELAKFMREGGRVVLLDDFGRGDAVLRHFGMERVPLPAAPAEVMRKSARLALAEPASAHPVVEGVTRVVLNHATGIRHPDLSPVLKVRSSDPRELDVAVGVAGAVGKGRLLVIADPSVVMNSMLRYSGNKALARGILKYALDDDTWGERNGRVFLVAGDVTLEGRYGAAPSPMTEALDAVRAHVDEIRSGGMPPPLLFALAVGLGIAIVVWVTRRAGKLHKPQSPRFTRETPLAAQGGVAGHAAIVASRHASRALAMLELKAALEEDLCLALGLEALPPVPDLLREVERAGLLDAEGRHALRRVLLKMAEAETLMLTRKGDRLPAYRDKDLRDTAAEVRRILESLAPRSAPAGAE